MKKIDIEINSEIFFDGMFSDYIFIDTKSSMTCACLFDIEIIGNEYKCFYTDLFSRYLPYKKQSIVIEYDILNDKAYFTYIGNLKSSTETICKALGNIYLDRLKDERNLLNTKTTFECFEVVNSATKKFLHSIWHMNHDEYPNYLV